MKYRLLSYIQNKFLIVSTDKICRGQCNRILKSPKARQGKFYLSLKQDVIHSLVKCRRQRNFLQVSLEISMFCNFLTRSKRAKVTVVESPPYSRLLAGPVEREAHPARFAGRTSDPLWSSLFLKDCTLWEGLMLEQVVKNCSPWDDLTLEKLMKDCLPGEGPHFGAEE